MNSQTTLSLILLLVIETPSISSAQTNITLEAVRDNTLYESATGAVSNGSGNYLFVGRTNLAAIRRAAILFDVSSGLPGGAVVDSVRLSLYLSRTSGASTVIRAHRLLADWGEASSDAGANEGQGTGAASGDATWLHTFFDTSMWTNPGGDFDPMPSAEATVDQPGPVDWPSSPGLVDDVQRWLAAPGLNFGWVFIGNEETSGTTKRFDSRENAASPVRPTLTVYYSTATAVEELTVPGAENLIATFPNPFRGSTNLVFRLEAPQPVIVSVYDITGREVRRLDPGRSRAGENRIQLDASSLPAGLYLIRVATPTSFMTTRMTVLG